MEKLGPGTDVQEAEMHRQGHVVRTGGVSAVTVREIEGRMVVVNMRGEQVVFDVEEVVEDESGDRVGVSDNYVGMKRGEMC